MYASMCSKLWFMVHLMKYTGASRVIMDVESLYTQNKTKVNPSRCKNIFVNI